MRSVSLAAIALAAVGTLSLAAIPSSAQSTITPNKPIFGYQDKEGLFHPTVRLDPEATATPTSGTVEVTFHITLKTPLPKGGIIACDTEMSEYTISSTAGATSEYQEAASKVATVSGATATCLVTIPYSWIIPPASGTVESVFSIGYSAAMLSGTATTAGIVRSSTGIIVGANKIPASGAVSKYTVAVTL